MIPESYVSLTEDLVGQSGWETKTGFQNLDPGTYKLVFLWRNDDWGGSNVAAMIDNVKTEKLSNEPNVSFATSLEFPLTEVGGSATATLTVTNTGGGDLNISGITFSNPDFELADAVEFPDVIASVGGEKSYKIKFTPSSEGEITGTMTIQSMPLKRSYPYPVPVSRTSRLPTRLLSLKISTTLTRVNPTWDRPPGR